MKNCPQCSAMIGNQATLCIKCSGGPVPVPKAMPHVEEVEVSESPLDKRYGFTADKIRKMYLKHSRKYPFIVLLMGLLIFGMEFYSLITTHRYYVYGVLLMPPMVLLGIGGLFDPDIFWGMRIYEVETTKRVISYCLGLGGLAVGAGLCYMLSFGGR